MKKKSLVVIMAVVMLFLPFKSNAQYYSIVNQAANMLQTAVVGGFRYKGFVDVSYTTGIGDLKANFVGVSTIHGLQYADWFFMGAGLGVDYVYSNPSNPFQGDVPGDHGVRTSGAMVPIFTDFRFNIGSKTSPSFFIDVKAGGSFLIGKNYLAIENGYINGSEYFMLKPSLGLRIPVNQNGKQAFNLSITYQLLTCNYWYYRSNSSTLSSLGATVSYEW